MIVHQGLGFSPGVSSRGAQWVPVEGDSVSEAHVSLILYILSSVHFADEWYCEVVLCRVLSRNLMEGGGPFRTSVPLTVTGSLSIHSWC